MDHIQKSSPRKNVNPNLAALRTWRSPTELLDEVGSEAGTERLVPLTPSPPAKHVRAKASPRMNNKSMELNMGDMDKLAAAIHAPPAYQRPHFGSAPGLRHPGMSPRHESRLAKTMPEQPPATGGSIGIGPNSMESLPEIGGFQAAKMPMSAVPPLDLGKISRGPSVAFLDGAQSSSNSLDVSRRLPASHRYHQQQQQAPCMSLTELGVDIAKLQSAGVSDGILIRLHRLIIAHSSGFHQSVRDALSDTAEAMRPEVLQSIWTAFFHAWSIELGTQVGGDIVEIADQHSRMADELTTRRGEAIQMRQGMQRLMRDAVERIVQERQDAKEREQLRHQVLKDRTVLRSTAVDLEATRKDRDSISAALADSRMALDEMKSKLQEKHNELRLLQKLHEDELESFAKKQETWEDKNSELETKLSRIETQLSDREAQATTMREEAMKIMTTANNAEMRSKETIEHLQEKIQQQARGIAMLQAHVENRKMEESELLQAKSSASENARAVINLQAELERLEADYKRDKHRLHEEGHSIREQLAESKARVKQLELQLDDLRKEGEATARRSTLSLESITKVSSEETGKLRDALAAANQQSEQGFAAMAKQVENLLQKLNDAESALAEQQEKGYQQVKSMEVSHAAEIQSVKTAHQAELQHNVSQLEAKLKSAQAELEDQVLKSQQRIRDLAETKGALAEALREKVEQAGSLKSLQQDVDNQRLRAEAAELEMKEAKSSLELSERAWADTYDQLQSEKSSRKALEDTVNATGAKATLEAATANARVVELTAELEALRDERDRVSTKLSSEEDTVRRLVPEAENHARRNAALEREIEAYRQRMESIKEELAKKDQQLKTAEGDIAKANERLEQREASVRETYEILTKTEKRVFDANAQIDKENARARGIQMELDKVDTEKCRLQGLHKELQEKYKQEKVRSAMQQQQLNAIAKGERSRLEVEGELRESVFNDLTRGCKDILNIISDEADACLYRVGAQLQRLGGGDVSSLQQQSLDPVKAFKAHVSDTLEMLAEEHDEVPRSPKDQDQEQEVNPNWGNATTSDLVKKHASKLVFSTAGAVKGLIFRLQSESVLLEEVSKRQLAKEERRGYQVAEDVAALLVDAAVACSEAKYLDESRRIDDLKIDSEDTKESISGHIRRIFEIIGQLKEKMTNEIDQADQKAREAETEAKSLFIKLAAAKSVVTMTKSSLDESSSQSTEMRAALRRAQEDITKSEQETKVLQEKIETLTSSLNLEVQMKEAGHRNMLAQAEDLEVRQREIAKLEQGFAQKEKKLQDLQNRSNGRLNNIRGALEKTMEENDSLRHAFLQVKVETAEQLTSVQLMIQETIQNVGKASKRAQAQELELQRRLSRATGLLEAKNSELAKLMSRLGGVVGKAELLKVERDFSAAEKRSSIEQHQRDMKDNVLRIAITKVALQVSDEFPDSLSINADHESRLSMRLASYVELKSSAMGRLGASPEKDKQQISATLLQEQFEALTSNKEFILHEAREVLETIFAQRAEASDVSAALASAQQRMADLDKKMDDLEAQEAAIDVALSTSAESDDEEMLRRRQLLEREKAKIEEHRVPINAELSGLHAQAEYKVKAMDKHRDDIQGETDAMQLEIDQLSGEVVRLKIELRESQQVDAVQGMSEEGMLSRLEETVNSLKALLTEAEQARDATEAECRELKAVNDKQSFQLAANSREIERLQEEEKVLIGKVAILEREKDLLEAASGPRKEGDASTVSVVEVKKLESKIFDLQSCVDSLTGEKQAVEAQLAALEQEAAKNRDLVSVGRLDLAAKTNAISQLHDLLKESQDTSGPFVASSGRRHVIRDWLSCLSDDVRYSLYNSEDAQNAPRGLVQFDKDTLQTIAGELYVLAMLENRRAFSSGRPVLRLHEHLYNLFFFRLGQRSYVEICLQGFIESLDKVIASSEDGFLVRLRSLLSLDPKDPVTPAGEGFYLHLLSSIQAAHGRAPAALIEDIRTSMIKTVNVKVAMHAVETCFTASKDESEKLLEEHARNAYAEAKVDADYDFRYRAPSEIGSEIQVQLIEMASDTKHQHLSMHEILEVSLRVYSREELREQRRLQALMHSLSGDAVGVPGMVSYDSFLVAVKRLHSGISESQVRGMYRDAMRQAPAGVVMPDSEVFAGVLIRHGCSSLRYKPPMIAQHFSDATVLENTLAGIPSHTVLAATWQGTRAKLQSIMTTMKSKVENSDHEDGPSTHEEVAQCMTSIQEAIYGLDVMMGSKAATPAAWSTMKSLLQNMLALHLKLKWSAKEKAMDIAGVTAFASLFGNTYRARAPESDLTNDDNVS